MPRVEAIVYLVLAAGVWSTLLARGTVRGRLAAFAILTMDLVGVSLALGVLL